MIIYAESSAVLSWMLGETSGLAVRRELEKAEYVVASDLTLVECDRAFHRALNLKLLSAEKFGELRRELRRLAGGWLLLKLGEKVIERARETFPEEPIRSLDALHLASALELAETVPDMAILTLDECLRRSGRSLGLPILPLSV